MRSYHGLGVDFSKNKLGQFIVYYNIKNKRADAHVIPWFASFTVEGDAHVSCFECKVCC